MEHNKNEQANIYKIFQKFRSKYSYPPIGLIAKSDFNSIEELDKIIEQKIFSSTIQIDNYHNKLLNSEEPKSIIIGLVSVFYWGYISSPGQAVARKKWLLFGKNGSDNGLNKLGISNATKIIVDAKKLINKNHFGKALLRIMEIPYIGSSFSSKITAFLCPENIGVLDNKITYHIKLGTFTTLSSDFDKIANSFSKQIDISFEKYCHLLQNIRDQINTSSFCSWKDVSGASMKRFRTVDVERALFSYALSKKKLRS